MADIILSEKEQELLNFIKEKGKVTLEEIETSLSLSHTGALGRLISKELIRSEKFRNVDTYNQYGSKMKKYYIYVKG